MSRKMTVGGQVRECARVVRYWAKGDGALEANAGQMKAYFQGAIRRHLANPKLKPGEIGAEAMGEAQRALGL